MDNSIMHDIGFSNYAIIPPINSSPPWCRIYASVNRVSIGSDNGLSPIQRQAII